MTLVIHPEIPNTWNVLLPGNPNYFCAVKFKDTLRACDDAGIVKVEL